MGSIICVRMILLVGGSIEQANYREDEVINVEGILCQLKDC